MSKFQTNRTKSVYNTFSIPETGLNELMLFKFKTNTRVFSDFQTAPDFTEILMDGTVFYADSYGMFFSRNEKLKSYSSSKLFFPIYL